MPRTGRPPVERVTNPCAACGKPVTMRKTDFERRTTGRVFCDLVCLDSVGGKPRKGQTLPCEFCGAPFYRRQSFITGPNVKRYCSRACLAEASKKPVQVDCAFCGVAFSTTPSTRRKYCGNTCKALAATTRDTGRMFNGKPVIHDGAGYLRIWLPDHPKASHGRILEHRYVVEQNIGRHLETEEHVHHINGVKDDNRLENLEVLSNSEHSTVTQADNRAALERLAEYERRFGPLT